MWQKIKNVYHLTQALAASAYFGFPSRHLTVLAVTGTDGKTTTISMIYHILNSSGKKTSMVSSLGAQIADESIDTGYHVTTPNPWQLQKLLKKAHIKGSEYFILEATSHGLDQNRLAFINIHIAIITNITSEHIDYHKSWLNYAKSKSKIFKNVKYSILNIDDSKSYNFLKDKTFGKVITYSQNRDADYDLKKYPIKLQVLGEYNLSNALAACAATNTLGIPKRDIISSLTKFSSVKGRLEKIDIGQAFDTIVDFAHTPHALETVLAALKKTNPKSRIIAVFGAAGERDASKRPLMGEIAAKYANIVVVTAEDPRNENPKDIAEDIASGLKKHGKKEDKDFFIVLDRRSAIQFAVNKAKKGDVLGFFGKGHEKSLCIGKKECPWNEIQEVENAVRKQIKNGKN